MYQKNTSAMDPYGIPVGVPAPQGGTAHLGPVQSMKPQAPATTGYRDWPFAVLFIGNVAAMIVLLVMWGIPVLQNTSSSTTSTKSTSSNNLLSDKEMRTVLIISGVMVVLSGVLSLVMLSFMVRFASGMITFSLWFGVGLNVLFTIYAVIKKQYALAILGAIFVLLSLCYAFAVRDRIPFAAANLRCAAAAIKKHASTYCVAFSMLVLQIVWVAVWATAALGLANHLNEKDATSSTRGKPDGSTCSISSECMSNKCSATYRCEAAGLKSASYVAYFFMLISFFWGMQTIKNVTHATVAGTVATWWYSTNSAGATGASLKRTLTTSFGSICLGSLIVAILQALRQLAEEARRSGDAAACIAECILGCLQSLMEYFNRWAFVYVGIYGYKFTDAGKAVIGLFRDRGFDTIINDDLIGNVLLFASLGVGFLCAGLGLVYTYIDTANTTFNNSQIIIPVMGLIFGIGISIIPFSVIDSAVATIFVCFAEDPAALQTSHPEHFNELMTEWHRMYPDIMVASGYYVVY
ncbi:hypothetical protein SPRG_19805 [Saprolegnia parasitica CBS 223.65]|uniref:Choline transporter-like protein n=1 Tax=Saprolegnia parasitica (strain CBS 223.65) TaxID=695850 RepID=A0A067CHQ4_SAPPC|nr:hypothetical protein SPRG_19805 [Saprolegnia parasitica CBS 223.65]KDO30254.1 hypothetical protein SPRG_19805 [Saprolegnia parasitica CBS 223.65]|eukprot:XP_012199058.1 hypothetical protein SPRG_19805 [Saprolegnia parasitica CBS 223.65]